MPQRFHPLRLGVRHPWDTATVLATICDRASATVVVHRPLVGATLTYAPPSSTKLSPIVARTVAV